MAKVAWVSECQTMMDIAKYWSYHEAQSLDVSEALFIYDFERDRDLRIRIDPCGSGEPQDMYIDMSNLVRLGTRTFRVS